MASAARDAASVDLRGLGPALRAHASARGLAVSEVMRQAVAQLLECPSSGPPVQIPVAGAREKPVKVTLRLLPGVSARLSAAARECGLSQGAYLMTLIDKAPAPPLAVSTELGRSTEQLAIVSGDMNELIRTLARGGLSSGPLLDDWIRPLLDDVRRHVGIASRLVAELRPERALPGQGAARTTATEEARP